MSKQFMLGTNIDNIINDEIESIVEEFIETLKSKHSVNLNNDSLLRKKLTLYMAPMINRLKYKYRIGR